MGGQKRRPIEPVTEGWKLEDETDFEVTRGPAEEGWVLITALTPEAATNGFRITFKTTGSPAEIPRAADGHAERPRAYVCSTKIPWWDRHAVNEVASALKDKLGYETKVDWKPTLQTFKDHVKKDSVVYFEGHGDEKKVQLKDKVLVPGEPGSMGGVSSLIFLNACATGNGEDWLKSFQSKCFMGWKVPIDDVLQTKFATLFFNFLDEGRTVAEAKQAAIDYRLPPSRGGMLPLSADERESVRAELMVFGDDRVVIDKSN